jgi:hemin uptake protein HemP
MIKKTPFVSEQVSPSSIEDGTDLSRRMKSTELFGAARVVIIEHGGNEYRLQVTSNDKLILTK